MEDNNLLSLEYIEWKKSLLGKSDKEVSLAIKQLILEKSGMDEKTKLCFNDIYDFFSKNTDAGKPIKMDLLKIYLEDIKGYNVKNINMYQIWILLALCGILINADYKK